MSSSEPGETACAGADRAGHRTLQAAIDQAAPGDTVVLCDRPGGHQGPVILRQDITLHGPATITGGPGPAVHILGGSVRLVSLTLTDGTGAIEPRLDGDTHGGVIAGWEADALWLEEVHIEGGSADWGGCITGPRSGPLTLVRSVVTGCRGHKLAGAIWMRQGELRDTEVSHSSAPYGGGIAVRSVSVADGDVFLPGTVVRDNEGDVQGGGLLLTGPAEVFGGRVEANRSEQGAGVFLADATGGWHGGVATENTATVGGGGVFVSGGQTTLSGLRLEGNVVSGTALPDGRGVGGGIWVSGDASTTVQSEDLQLLDNRAAWGAGWMVSGAGTPSAGPLVAVTGGAWATQAASDGGGAAIVGARMEVSGVDIHANEAERGGGIWLDAGELRARGGTWSANTPDDIHTPAGSSVGPSDRWIVCSDAGCTPEAD